MSGESALTMLNAAMGSRARGAASAAFVIENRFSRSAAKLLPPRSEQRSRERWPMMKIMQIAHICSQKTYKNWTSLLKKEGWGYNCGHTYLCSSGDSEPQLGQLWTPRLGPRPPCSLIWIFPPVDAVSFHPLHITYKETHWNCVSCPAVHMWTVLWLHVTWHWINKRRQKRRVLKLILAQTSWRGGGGWTWRTIADSRFYPFATFKDWRIMVVFGGAGMQKPHGPVKGALIYERILQFCPFLY